MGTKSETRSHIEHEIEAFNVKLQNSGSDIMEDIRRNVSLESDIRYQ